MKTWRTPNNGLAESGILATMARSSQRGIGPAPCAPRLWGGNAPRPALARRLCAASHPVSYSARRRRAAPQHEKPCFSRALAALPPNGDETIFSPARARVPACNTLIPKTIAVPLAASCSPRWSRRSRRKCSPSRRQKPNTCRPRLNLCAVCGVPLVAPHSPQMGTRPFFRRPARACPPATLSFPRRSRSCSPHLVRPGGLIHYVPLRKRPRASAKRRPPFAEGC